MCIKGKKNCEKESLSQNPQTTNPPTSHPCCWRGPWRLVNLIRFQNMLNKLKRALKVGQPQEVPKHVQQVAKYGLKFCAKKTYHESKHLSPPSSPSNPSFVIEQRWEGLGQPQHVLEIFSSAQVPRERATNISRSATLAISEVQHLLSFSSSRQEELFYSSSYCRLKIPLLPRSVMTFSSTVLPLSTFSSSTTLPPSHKNIFLYSLVIPQQSFSRLYCPLPTISYSSPPPKNLSSLIPSSCASSSLASFTALLEARWMCGHAALSVPNPRASCLAVRCTRFLGIFAAEYSTYASFPIQYSVSVDFQFTTMFRATWQRYKSV